MFWKKKKNKSKGLKIYTKVYVVFSVFFVCFLFFVLIYPPINHVAAYVGNPGAGITICIDPNPQPGCYNADYATPGVNWSTAYTTNENTNCNSWCDTNVPPAGTCSDCYNKSFVSGTVTLAGNFVSNASAGNFTAPYAWHVPTNTVIAYSFSAFDALGDNPVASGNFTTAVMCAPAAPSNVNIVTNNCRQVTVSWTDNSTSPNPIEDHFEIQLTRANPAGNSGIYTSAANTASLSISDAFVMDGATYTASVRSVNKDGLASGWIPSIGNTATPLCAPTIGVVSSGGCNNITVNWTDNSVNESGYDIIFDDLNNVANGNDDFTVNVAGTAPNVSGGGLVYVSNSVPDGVNWSVSVVTRKGAASSPASGSVPVTTVLCVPGINNVSSPSCNRIITQGTDPSIYNNEDVFRVYFIDLDPGINGDDGGFYDAVNNINNVNTSGIPDGVRWNVYIVAYNAVVGESGQSVWLPVNTQLCTPTGITAADGPLCNDMTATWNDNSVNEDWYEVRFTDTNPTGGTRIEIFPADGIEVDIETLMINDALDGVNWNVDIRAVNSIGAVSPSSWSAIAQDWTFLCTPLNLNAITTVCSDALGWLVNLQWEDKSSNETGYEIQRDPDTTIWEVDPNSPASSFASGNLTFPGLGTWTVLMPPSIDSYRYQVRAFNGFVIPSAWSNIEVRRTYFCNPEIAPITNYNCDYVTFTWDVDGLDSEVDYYNIYRTISNDPYGGFSGIQEHIDQVNDLNPGGPETYTDNDIMSAVLTYTYEVVAYCAAGNCPDYKGFPLADQDMLLHSFISPVVTLPCGNLPTRWWEDR
ncbi:hypothetical protein A2331_01655 [Candidatus Falkowbacteria bacterium RIFOXYB2_FULL_34_18]|uniref:Fibronectin type-III domain-containing protein n=1 Tax=Candidatus Falkowbacteria bacterium RIFOXYD2_FULL_34_120 TaxID=1798007 RepID=A0A1F5TQX7_9BACT|nr:MAG: hypothetical protein A2331_01655 [Candidatus Falkowbacteria bacterium RIFOXYB2_FULL_34_18]OGF29317.1 MAG: hypothetical protein A2500_05535 [Candidatus Falkowbacteria bacterium RIFOXYC12_FULL_34_55]OGF36433.1 MAG: hypothetical protein A2466_01195 [Candidatus Falkowbacteria bacterium RIFOXYC2_FULL_34_220]OGF38912.1 MAG: hypothetical protein A2515_05955 [Candidatus Falkowbacteria bacterium RIFOXYD12_FULL_34_57]OGF40931.1 MAG: hypothetical protein A2531_04180 [Candidatus Falkowbacteria bact